MVKSAGDNSKAKAVLLFQIASTAPPVGAHRLASLREGGALTPTPRTQRTCRLRSSESSAPLPAVRRGPTAPPQHRSRDCPTCSRATASPSYSRNQPWRPSNSLRSRGSTVSTRAGCSNRSATYRPRNMRRRTMSTCAGPRRSKTVSPRGSSSLHRPAIVAPWAFYEVECPSIDAEFSGVARFTGGGARRIHIPTTNVTGRPPSACMTFFARCRTRYCQSETRCDRAFFVATGAVLSAPDRQILDGR